ncbi:hypothetical protein [Ralstonia pseudosolanacearum]|uniref:hypothetical protein n=1 Tax=Ralstonia pseudosolanacearum TaxID=1310165 RepID=UPI0015863402|nr:hypothetical protein [Ralstonia pseudosolanacearum]
MASLIRVLEAAVCYRGGPLSDGVGRPAGAAGNRDRCLPAQFGRDGRGHPRIGATAPCWVRGRLDRFYRVDPGIEAGNSVQMFEALQAYRVDMASLSHRVRAVRFLRIELARDPLVRVVHRGHLLAAQCLGLDWFAPALPPAITTKRGTALGVGA